jgi:hypothetical protein
MGSVLPALVTHIKLYTSPNEGHLGTFGEEGLGWHLRSLFFPFPPHMYSINVTN